MIIVLTRDAAGTIAAAARESADGRETGGVLLGHDLGERMIVTVAGDPGPAADRRTDGFVRDLAHARLLGDEAYDRDGSVWVGEWHTHPTGPSIPSPKDMETYSQLLADDDLAFERLLALIVTPCGVHGWVEAHVHGWVVDVDGAKGATVVRENVAGVPLSEQT